MDAHTYAAPTPRPLAALDPATHARLRTFALDRQGNPDTLPSDVAALLGVYEAQQTALGRLRTHGAALIDALGWLDRLGAPSRVVLTVPHGDPCPACGKDMFGEKRIMLNKVPLCPFCGADLREPEFPLDD